MNRPQPSQMIVYWTATRPQYAQRNDSRTAVARPSRSSRSEANLGTLYSCVVPHFKFAGRTESVPPGSGLNSSPAGAVPSSQPRQSDEGSTAIWRLWYGATSGPGSTVNIVNASPTF